MDDYFPIRTVAAMTGVNPVTLRTWERRYGLLEPRRTPSGHRLYSRDDIDRINRVLAKLELGLSIGQVATAIRKEAAVESVAADNGWNAFRRRIIGGIEAFDEDAVEAVYEEALALNPVRAVTDRLIVPLLWEIGARWERGEGTVAEEHFFGAFVRNKLGARFHHRHTVASGPALLAACGPGEHHEIGLLLFALAAHEQGFRIVMLGADMPLDGISAAARRSRSDAVVVAVHLTPDATMLRDGLSALVRGVELPVFVGGRGAAAAADFIAAAGARPLGEDVDRALERIADVLVAGGGPDDG